MKNRLYLLLVVVALSCLAGWTGYAQGQRGGTTRQAWEYTVVSRCNSSSELKESGAEGWELVAVVYDSEYRRNECYLKRAR
jgi:hypothetical protein